jgi:DNA-binding CsgD family transcriptional regulator
VTALRRRELEDALELVHAASSANSADPFPQPVVELFARVVPGDSLAYYEWDLNARERPQLLVEAPSVARLPGVAEAVYHYCASYPLSNLRLATASRPCRLSDFASRRTLHRLDYYHYVLRPSGIEHQTRLFLSAPPAKSRVFYFNRARTDRDFADHELSLLQLLRPFFVAIRDRFEFRKQRLSLQTDDLTDREREILEWVAVGKTNQEIAEILWVAPSTIRKHLENVYAKLGVHTRTAAVARASVRDE